MTILNGNYILKASGASTAVIDEKVFAPLLSEPLGEKWLITPVPASGKDVVIIQTNDRSKAWTASISEDSQELEQITVQPLNSGSPAPNQLFRIVLLADELPVYLAQILTNSSGNGVGRYIREDLSLLPKRVLTLPKGIEIPQWLIEKA